MGEKPAKLRSCYLMVKLMGLNQEKGFTSTGGGVRGKLGKGVGGDGGLSVGGQK